MSRNGQEKSYIDMAGDISSPIQQGATAGRRNGGAAGVHERGGGARAAARRQQQAGEQPRGEGEAMSSRPAVIHNVQLLMLRADNGDRRE